MIGGVAELQVTVPMRWSSAVLCLFFLGVLALPCHAEWEVVAPGLELREFVMPDPGSGDLSGAQGSVAVLRIDPNRFTLRVGSVLNTGQAVTVQDWARQHRFVAVINAGMFRADDRQRSTGYLRDKDLVVNSFIHPDYGAFLVFGPKEPGLPVVRWVDRRANEDWGQIIARYDGVIQNYRLFNAERVNLWPADERRHSAAAIGMDQQGRVLFVHCRPKVSMHEFTQALLDLPLELIGAMYVEGGADAAMYVQSNGWVGRWVGEYRTSFFQGSNKNFWPVPNVLGILPK